VAGTRNSTGADGRAFKVISFPSFDDDDDIPIGLAR